MRYITVSGKNFEDALAKARADYGSNIRVHSRRDIKGMFGRTITEINFYIDESDKVENDHADVKLLQRFEKEALTPAPRHVRSESHVEERRSTSVEAADSLKLDVMLEHAAEILRINDFSASYIEELTADLRSELAKDLPSLPSDEKFELLIIDHIIASVEIDHDSQLHPPKIFILLGPTGTGKTTTIAKIAALYCTVPPKEFRRTGAIITLDTFRIGAYEQIASFGEKLGLPVLKAEGEQNFYTVLEGVSDKDLILVDTLGKSPRDTALSVRLKTLLSVPDKHATSCYLAVSASMKEADILKALDQFSIYGIRSMIVTKTDETDSIGNIISISHEKKLPMLFITDGQRVPEDIHKASSALLLSMLKGFSMDLSYLWKTQTGELVGGEY